MKYSSAFFNSISAPGILLSLLKNVSRQKKFLNREFRPGLDSAISNNDGSLDEEDIHKVLAYYGLAVPSILGEALCVLRGQPMTGRERLALTYQGAMTGLFDDFFDKDKISDEAVKQFLIAPQSVRPGNSRQALFLEYYRKALEYSHHPGLTLNYLQKVYEAQIESREQAIRNKLSIGELTRITINKGGQSVLFYRTVLANKLDRDEEEALYRVGGLMQLGNDIFDIYKDCKQGIDTMMTVVDRVDITRGLFIEMMEQGFDAFYLTSYPRKNIRKFLQLISMCLCARCFVCLDQLERKEKDSGRFTPHTYNRQALVCDMQKPINKYRTISYFIKKGIPVR